MLAFRFLSLPLAMLMFCAVYSASLKVPRIVEGASIVLWIMTGVVLVLAVIRKCRAR
jgi:hypothetical protein